MSLAFWSFMVTRFLSTLQCLECKQVFISGKLIITLTYDNTQTCTLTGCLLSFFFLMQMTHVLSVTLDLPFLLSLSSVPGLLSLCFCCWVRIRLLCSSRLSGGDTRYTWHDWRQNSVCRLSVQTYIKGLTLGMQTERCGRINYRGSTQVWQA